MGKEMLTVKLKPNEATLPAVRRKLKLLPEDIDHDFGVVNIDPKQNLYAILVEPTAARRASKQDGIEGPFSNPKIETFGPPTRPQKKQAPPKR
jgi:hypothetical protein